MSLIAPSAADELRLRLRGGLHEPGDPAYADACTLFNSMIERRPAYVAACATPDDVVAALAFAREHGLDVAVRAGGHSVAGQSLVDDGLVIDLRPMSDVEVDPQRRIARVGGGATWAHVDRATTAHGLATTGGRVSTTGVAGLALGGGSGWLERKHGLACDNLLAADLVTADGRLVRASSDENPELLWALRGGGGNFGVVYALELALHPIEEQVLAGLIIEPAARGAELLARFRDVMHDAPDELDLAFIYLTGPAEEGIPEHLHGEPCVAIAGMYAGPLGEAEAVLAPIRDVGPEGVDLFEPMGYADFQCALDDPPGYRNYWTAEHLHDLGPEAIAAIHERAGEMLPGPAQLFIAAWGGQVARVGGEHSPLAGRDTRYVIHPLFLWTDPAEDEHWMRLGRSFRELLAPWATGDIYLNFVGDEGEGRRRAGFGEHHDRLARIKAQWDPQNVFRSNQNIAPAT